MGEITDQENSEYGHFSNNIHDQVGHDQTAYQAEIRVQPLAPGDTLNPLCSWSVVAETTLHLFLRCQFHNDKRKILMTGLVNIDRSLSPLSLDKLISILLYRSDVFDNKTNCKIQFALYNSLKTRTDLTTPFC